MSLLPYAGVGKLWSAEFPVSACFSKTGRSYTTERCLFLWESDLPQDKMYLYLLTITLALLCIVVIACNFITTVAIAFMKRKRNGVHRGHKSNSAMTSSTEKKVDKKSNNTSKSCSLETASDDIASKVSDGVMNTDLSTNSFENAGVGKQDEKMQQCTEITEGLDSDSHSTKEGCPAKRLIFIFHN